MAKSAATPEIEAISEISVAGLKSIGKKQSIEIRPLTILAGTNSSGKSSMMQGLLLLKQTLEATYDPGPLLLNGPNVAFTKVDQLFAKEAGSKRPGPLEVGLCLSGMHRLTIRFKKNLDSQGFPIQIDSQVQSEGADSEELNWKTQLDELKREDQLIDSIRKSEEYTSGKTQLRVYSSRCFLGAEIVTEGNSNKIIYTLPFFNRINRVISYERAIRKLIHIPGHRGQPTRTYPLTPIDQFTGTFIPYFGSLVAAWTSQSSQELSILSAWLNHLGLTWTVEGHAIDDTRVELRVGRLPKTSKASSKDLVDLADVGLGVPHILPVLVALLVAKPGQLVYIEQPEIHLHPRAQFLLAQAFVDAANRGVRVVVETHSSLFLLGVQSLVAEGKLSPDKLKLHWFSRSPKTGETTVTSGEVDAEGRFGEWPEDFDDVTIEAHRRYLDAVEAKLSKSH